MAALPGSLSPKDPIIFASDGEPDICLVVFDQEFHCHSAVLKLYSEFFSTFLDSPDKENMPKIFGKFKYKWVTKVDEDGKGWFLTASGHKTGDLRHNFFSQGVSFQEHVFEKFLRALYGLPYSFYCIDELHLLTEWAEYYFALPRISLSVTGAIKASRDSNFHVIQEQPIEILDIAIKLRHKKLFRDAIIIGASCPSPSMVREWIFESKYSDKLEPSFLKEIGEILQRVRGRVDDQINKTMRALMDDAKTPLGRNPKPQKEWAVLSESFGEKITDASAFRKAHQLLQIEKAANRLQYPSPTRFETQMKILLANQLYFNPEAVSGGVYWSSSFFCGIVKDEDFPWDVNETS